MEFKDILKDLRYESSLSQKEVAQECDLSPQCISQLEQGSRNPTGTTLVALADFFECTIDYLMGREDSYKKAIYHQTDTLNQLSPTEQHLIDLIRNNPPFNILNVLTLYSELPLYLQESIYSEIKGAALAHKATKNKQKGDK